MLRGPRRGTLNDLRLSWSMLRNEIAAQTLIIGLKVNNAEKEAIVPGHNPRIPPKLHRQNASLCLNVVSEDLINIQVEVRRTRNTTARQKVHSTSCVLVIPEHEYTEDIADKEHISIDVG